MFLVFHSARFHSGFVEILFWGGAVCHWVRAHFVTGLVRTLSLGSWHRRFEGINFGNH
jgi:hypothetical protein